MKRKDFLSSAGKIGICSCIGMPMIVSDIFASSDDEKKKDDWRIGFMQKRFAKFIDIIKSNVSDEEKERIFQGLGQACSQEGKEQYSKNIGNIDTMLDALKKSWIETVDYDKASGVIKLYGKKTGKCGCPFVSDSQIAKDFCHCSIGNVREMWSTIAGKPVEASIIEAVLYGAERCSFQIKIG